MAEIGILVYIVSCIMILVAAVFLARWILRVDKIVKGNDAIIELLAELAKKDGVESEQIERIRNRYQQPM
ncbi:hypothetical protein [Flavihumibacter petaseus]|uniref:Uncharacterized protein n=1 Tax=Flavihumibacter petaseus NBRC 106054 TaxID=1220578 RepID=A0A0E9MZ97_9BACT|nr:hypothetical protein [Flavihumibacter petaseus]GAO43062.1 hypothetical protein FPE01S_02_01670 [Flavihumibacter petaseus NBRC 106054]